MEKFNWNYLWIGLIGILIGMGLMDLIQRNDSSAVIIKQPDTTYNRVKLDSINVQIGKHDTTIYNLKIKLNDDKEASFQLDDSSSIELFRKLATSTDSIK